MRPDNFHEQPMRDCTPGALFELAACNPLVKSALTEWERGTLRWDEMLMWLVIHLTRHCQELETLAVKQAARAPFTVSAVFTDTAKKEQELKLEAASCYLCQVPFEERPEPPQVLWRPGQSPELIRVCGVCYNDAQAKPVGKLSAIDRVCDWCGRLAVLDEKMATTKGPADGQRDWRVCQGCTKRAAPCSACHGLFSRDRLSLLIVNGFSRNACPACMENGKANEAVQDIDARVRLDSPAQMPSPPPAVCSQCQLPFTPEQEAIATLHRDRGPVVLCRACYDASGSNVR